MREVLWEPNRKQTFVVSQVGAAQTFKSFDFSAKQKWIRASTETCLVETGSVTVICVSEGVLAIDVRGGKC